MKTSGTLRSTSRPRCGAWHLVRSPLRGTGATQRYVALYHFASPEVPNSAKWRKAADTPWTLRLRPHFRDVVRFDCRRYRHAA